MNKCFLCGTSDAQLKQVIAITDDDKDLTAVHDNIKVLGSFYSCGDCECVLGSLGFQSWQDFLINAISEEIERERRINGGD